MTATVPTYLKLLATHHPSAELWPEETTIAPRDQFPGEVVSLTNDPSRLLWNGYGTYEGAAGAIYLGISRSGYPDASARYIWTIDPDAGPAYGWDPMTHITHVGPVAAYGGGADRYARVSICQRGDGGLVCITSPDPAATSGTEIRMYTREAGAAWVSRGDISSTFTTAPTDDYPAGWGACPTVARGEDGAVYVAAMVHTQVYSDYETNVDIYRAATDATWTASPFVPFIRGALAKTVHTTNATGLAFAIGGGQVFVFIETSVGRAQYASIMPGQLEFVEAPAVGDGVTCKYLVGRFIVAYVTAAGKLCVRRLGSAFDQISAATEIEIGDNEVGTRVALWADEDGTIYIAGRKADTVRIYESRDAGQTWVDTMLPFNTVADCEATGSTLASQTLDACRWRGGACLLAQSKASIGGTGYGHSLASMDVGGWTSWAIPSTNIYNVAGSREPRAIAVAQWSCLSDPVLQPSITIAATGGGSAAYAFTTDLRYNVTTTGARVWKLTPTTMPAPALFRTAILRSAIEPLSGAVEHAILTAGFGLRILHDSTTVEAFDASTSASLGTHAVTGIYELYAAVDNLTGAYVIYGRVFSDSDIDARVMVNLLSGTLTADTFTPEISTKIGNVASTGRSADIALWGVYYLPAGSEVSPEIPYGRPVSASGTYTTNGISFAGEYGPALYSEGFSCAPDSLWSLVKAPLTETYPSLREHFRSADLGDPGAASTAAYLAFKIGVADIDYLAPIVASYVWSNAQQVVLQANVGGSWTTVGTVKSYITGSGTGVGTTIHAVVAAAATSFNVGRDEFAGGWIESGGEVYTIAGNSAGLVLSLGEPGSQVVFRTTVAIVTPFTAADIKIVPPFTTSAFGPSAAITGDGIKAAKGFRLTLSGTIPPGGYWKIKTAIGFADVLGLSHGLNTVRSSTPNTITNATRSGVMRRERIGPPTRTIEFSWQDILDPETPQTRTILTATPDRIDDSYGNTLAIAGTTYSIARAYIEDCGSTGRPVIYFPAYDVAAKLGWSEVGYGGAVVGSIVPDTWITEHALGREEQHVDHLRGGTIKIVEVS